MELTVFESVSVGEAPRPTPQGEKGRECMSELDTLKERIRNIEARMDTADRRTDELVSKMEEGFKGNASCHTSLKAKLGGIEITLGIIETKLSGLNRVFWIVVAAVVTGAVGILFSAFAVIAKSGGLP